MPRRPPRPRRADELDYGHRDTEQQKRLLRAEFADEAGPVSRLLAAAAGATQRNFPRSPRGGISGPTWWLCPVQVDAVARVPRASPTAFAEYRARTPRTGRP
ncbi:MAG: hypothetical protein M0026_21595, partial [Nocardiopsaceae bacterium]|nr:hypothetical protein [Nocardiopsaceae bacterium]